MTLPLQRGACAADRVSRSFGLGYIDLSGVMLAAMLMGLVLIAVPAYAGGQDEVLPIEEPEQVLLFGLSGDPNTLDPHATTGTLTFQSMNNVYETLIEHDGEGGYLPALATRWETSEDLREITFHLRQGVVFHHGKPFRAEDVVATMRRLKDPEFAGPSAHEYSIVDSVETPDDSTVVLKLSEPSAPLMATLASGWSAILPADLIDTGHNFNIEPIGTGPFQVSSWVRGSEIVLKRFDNHWTQTGPGLNNTGSGLSDTAAGSSGTGSGLGDTAAELRESEPQLDEVRFKIIPEQAVQAQALMQGQLHVADLLVEPELTMIRDHPDTTTYRAQSALVMVLALNNRRDPLDRLAVRRAINAAIDKQLVMNEAYAGGTVVGSFIDPGSPYYVDYSDVYEYDPAFAEEEFSKLELSRELVLTLPQNYAPHVRAGELYHEMLRQAGLPVRIQLVDWSTWISDVYTDHNFDMTVIGHTGKLDPDGRLERYGTGQMYVGWENAEAVSAIEQARRTLEFEDRFELYSEVFTLMARELPFVFVGSPFRYVGLRKEVTGFRMNPRLDTYDLRNIRIQSD